MSKARPKAAAPCDYAGLRTPGLGRRLDRRGVSMKRTIRTVVLLLVLAVSVPAVAGLYEDFFQATGSAQDGIPSKLPPQVYTSSDLDADMLRLLEDGYFPIGRSSWVGTPEDIKKTTKFAKKIKASVALVNYRYIETVSGGTRIVMMPVIGGYGGMIGGAHPVSFDRYEQTTFFFVKLKPEINGFGFRWDNLTTQQASAVGSGKGIVVRAIVRGSTAFDAGIIKGDIILTIAGQDISTPERNRQVRTDFANQTVPVEIIREGKPQTLQITVPAAPASDAKR